LVSIHEDIRNFIRSLPDVEQKHDPLSTETYFYGFRNFAHFHGSKNIDIRLSMIDQEVALRKGMALKHHYAPQAGWVSCVLETKEQAEIAKKLINQAYDHNTRSKGKTVKKNN
jgi:hypothetical protein